MSILNPLTDKHCEALDCVLGNYQNVKDTIQACEDCDLDMTSQKERLEAQKTIASKLKAKFNPLAT
jgi:hypothetical protein